MFVLRKALLDSGESCGLSNGADRGHSDHADIQYRLQRDVNG